MSTNCQVCGEDIPYHHALNLPSIVVLMDEDHRTIGVLRDILRCAQCWRQAVPT